MLQRLASPALTSAIVDIFLEDLRQLPEPEQAALHKAAAGLITRRRWKSPAPIRSALPSRPV